MLCETNQSRYTYVVNLAEKHMSTQVSMKAQAGRACSAGAIECSNLTVVMHAVANVCSE